MALNAAESTVTTPARLLRPHEVADRLALSVSRVYALVGSGSLPAINVSSSPGRTTLRIREDAFDAWLRERAT